MRQRKRVRSFVFTLNNWTEEEYSAILTWGRTMRWFICGKEVGENGTPHLQGACVIGGQKELSTISKLAGLQRAHIEPMQGSAYQNYKYCGKDKDFVEFGETPQPGKRNDILKCVELIKDGKDLRELADDTECGVVIVKYHKGLSFYSSLLRKPLGTDKKIIWIWGDTGTGKSENAHKCAALLSKEGRYWANSTNLQWFDGYNGQDCVIFDDHRSSDCAFNWLLKLTDIYPLDVPIKGGFVPWVPKFIFITAPNRPSDTWYTARGEELAQLTRRISLEVDSSKGYSDMYDMLCVRESAAQVPVLSGDLELQQQSGELDELFLRILEQEDTVIDLTQDTVIDLTQ